MIHNPIIVGESTKGLMKFTARVSYTGSALGERRISISPKDGEMLMVVDNDGAIQIVNPIILSPYVMYPSVIAHSSGKAYEIEYNETDVALNISGTITLGSVISAVHIGTLETL